VSLHSLDSLVVRNCLSVIQVYTQVAQALRFLLTLT